MTLLAVAGLVKRFGGLTATDGVDLTVEPGEVHAVIGPNGAGKTTLINQLSGELAPDAGSIRFDGRDITREPVYRRALLGLGRSYQITSVFPEFTRAGQRDARRAGARRPQLLVLAAAGRPRRRWSRRARDALDAGRPRGEAPDVPVATLAHGERRQLEVAMTLAPGPQLLLLDEPMAGMSLAESERMVALLGALKGRYGILLVEHDMDAVFKLADRISVLVYGRVIACGDPEAIRANADVRAAYLGDAGHLACALQGADRAPDMALLDVDGLTAFYGTSQVLFGMTFAAEAGECVTLLGRNGMGKTTTVKSVIGMLRRRTAAACASTARTIGGWPSYRIAQAGIGLVPEMRQIFPTLTVRENLVATARARRRRGRPRRGRWIASTRCSRASPNAQSQPGQPAVRRRAADARDRPRADDQSAPADPRRGHRRAWRRSCARRSGSCLATLKRDGLTLIVIDKNIGPLRASPTATTSSRRAASRGTAIRRRCIADPAILHQYVGV